MFPFAKEIQLWAPLYYGEFVWSQKYQKSYIPYLYKSDLCKADTWFCPFGVRIKEVWLYYVCQMIVVRRFHCILVFA